MRYRFFFRLGELEAASRERADAMQNSFRAPGLEEGDEGTTSGDSEEQQGLKEELVCVCVCVCVCVF